LKEKVPDPITSAHNHLAFTSLDAGVADDDGDQLRNVAVNFEARLAHKHLGGQPPRA
jgi:hypothetical protein